MLLLLSLPAGACSSAAPPARSFADCLACHGGIETLDDEHRFECADCHLLPEERGKALTAHAPVIRNPSAPDRVSIFCGRCHAREIRRVESSLHATMAGVINQTRFLWGAQEAPAPARYSANGAVAPLLPHSPAYPDSPDKLVDDFLRRKCLRCHLGTAGAAGPGLYRAAGCAACHVLYNTGGRYLGRDKAIDKSKPGYPERHAFAALIPDSQCLHCHNGNHVGGDYEGLFEHDHERFFRSPTLEGKPPERLYGIEQHRLARDVHAEKGLSCLDCHSGEEVMGDGTLYGSAAEVPRRACEDCHGGYGREAPHPGLVAAGKILAQDPEAGYQFPGTDGALHALPLFSRDIPGHNATWHTRLRCSACHAQWSFQDYGLSLMRKDGGDFSDWSRLTIQADPALEDTLTRLAAAAEPGLPVSKDWLSGEHEPGIWLSGWRFRRWEPMPLGLDGENRFAILRPLYQYLVSYVDRWGSVVLDSAIPERGDGSGKGWAFAPYEPHTIAPAGRPCAACHLSDLAAGRGIFTEAGPDTDLFLPSPPALATMRLLSAEEQERLLTPSLRFRAGWLRDLERLYLQ